MLAVFVNTAGITLGDLGLCTVVTGITGAITTSSKMIPIP